MAFIRSAGSRRDFLKYMGAATASAFVASAVEPALAQPASGPADVIFRGGPILTINGKAPRAEAIAIRGNKIVAVGKAEDIQGLNGAKTRVVDLKGRTLMPGLIDPHMHFVFTVFEDWIDVSPITTPDYATVLAKLKAGVAKAKEGEWVRAQQFDSSITRDAHIPTLAELDEISPKNPFFMQESNGHIAYANSLAFKAVGITRDTPNPSGARFVRDANGNLTGRLEEMAAQEVFIKAMPSPSAAEMAGRTKGLIERCASVGCTMVHDNGVGLMAGMQDLALLDAVAGNANSPLRYRGMLISTLMDEWEKQGIKPGRGNDFFRVDGIKAWADGSNQAQTGYQRENYLGTNARGALNYTLAEVTEVIRRSHAGGWQVGVHANGDAAIDMTIDAYEAVLGANPNNDLRHRIEHCSMLHPEQMARMKKLGLSPSFLTGHIRWWALGRGAGGGREDFVPLGLERHGDRDVALRRRCGEPHHERRRRRVLSRRAYSCRSRLARRDDRCRLAMPYGRQDRYARNGQAGGFRHSRAGSDRTGRPDQQDQGQRDLDGRRSAPRGVRPISVSRETRLTPSMARGY